LGINKKIEIDEGLRKGIYVLVKKDDCHIVGRYRKISDDTSKFYTILKHLNKNGVNELNELGLGKYFSFPKPLSLLKELILGSTILSKKEKNIILDFYSGSSTTAHAVMQLNAEDGGNRKFIMVQLPEETDPKSEAYKAGYKNICEIGKERIRRAGEV
jgi:adenine-specific DNA-methyltransferase